MTLFYMAIGYFVLNKLMHFLFTFLHHQINWNVITQLIEDILGFECIEIYKNQKNNQLLTFFKCVVISRMKRWWTILQSIEMRFRQRKQQTCTGLTSN